MATEKQKDAVQILRNVNQYLRKRVFQTGEVHYALALRIVSIAIANVQEDYGVY
jgi:hypothetical protein